MIQSRGQQGYWFVVVSFIIAIILDILPLPAWALWIRPKWTLLVLIYWVMVCPNIVGVGWAFCVGVVTDFLQGSFLGEHALAAVLVAYLMLKLHQLIRVYPFLQQMLVVFLVVLLYQMIIFILQGITVGYFPHKILYWVSAGTSMLIWPWLYWLMYDWSKKILIV
jgi:rod shape-determining protein MreD